MAGIESKDYTQGAKISSLQAGAINEGLNPLQRFLQQLQQQKAERDLQEQRGEQAQGLEKLKSYLEGQRENQQIQSALGLQSLLGNSSPGHRYNVSVGGAHISEADQAQRPSFALTPAQEAAEKEAGKKIEAYEVAGGKPSADRALSQLGQSLDEVQDNAETGTKKTRDNYDRIVGGVLKGHPTLQGFFAPTEKARMDRMRNVVGNIIRQTDPNPAQSLIDQVFGQVYDPASTDSANADRIRSFYHEKKAQVGDIENASRRYHNTGYATVGASPGAPLQAPKTSGGALSPSEQAELEQLKKELGQ